MKWGKVPPADMAMDVYPTDSSASAVVLCDYGRIQVNKDYTYNFYRYRRIKILKESGLNYGNITIPFYHAEGLDRIIGLKAQVITPDGEKQEISKKDIFTEKRNDYWSTKRFSVPNLQEGSVIEYNFVVESKRISQLRDWYFHDEIPVRYSELRVAIDASLEYIFLFQGGEEMVQTTDKNGTVIMAGPGGAKARFYKGRYIMENLSAIVDEPYMTCEDDYRARIRFQLSKYMQNGYIENNLNTWDEVTKGLEKSLSFGAQYNKRNNFKKLSDAATPLIETAKTQKEKVEIFYKYLSHKIEWNGYYGKYVEGKLDRVFEEGKGTSTEPNLMLIALLREQGIKAFPLFVSTRSHGKMIQEHSIMDQFNHVMVYVILDDGEILIADIGDPKRPLGLPRINALNSVGWLMMEANPQWVEIRPKRGSDSYIAEFEITASGDVKGVLKGNYTGYNAIPERRRHLNKEAKKYWEESFTARHSDIEIDSIINRGIELIEEPFQNAIYCNLSGAVQQSGDFMYCTPILFSHYSENKFKLENRTYPVDMPYPFKEHYVLNLKIPDGYEVSQVPDMVKLVMPNGGGSFKYLVSQDGNTIQVVSSLDVKQLHYSPNEYTKIKDFFDRIAEKHGEQLVLKKIE